MEPLTGIDTLRRILRRRWQVMVVVFVVTIAVGILWILQRPRSYTATALIRITSEYPGNVELDLGTLQTIERLNLTFAQIAVQPTTMDHVRRIVGVDWPDHYLKGKIAATPIKNTHLIEIRASDEDPDVAELLANATAQALIERQHTLERETPTGTTLQIVEEARRPVLPSSYPRRAQLLAIAAGACFLIIVVGLVTDRVDRRIESRQDVASDLQIPLVGTVDRYRRRRMSLVSIQDAYQNIASTLGHVRRQEPVTALSVTGTRPGEGKSFTIANLAFALHEIGNDVVLVDLDLRRPALHTLFNIEDTRGIGPAIMNNKPLPQPTPTQFPGVSLIPAGKIPPAHAARIYESPRLQELLTHCTPRGGTSCWLLVDLPPVLAAPSTVTAASVFKNTIFVARAGLTRVRDAMDVLDALSVANVHVVGAVLTGVQRHGRGYDAGYHTSSETKTVLT